MGETRRQNGAVKVHGRRPQGFSLIELMVAVALGMVLILGVVTVVTNTTKNFGEVAKTSQQIENARYAIQTLRDEIRNAGYFGRFSTADVPDVLPNSCVFSLEALRDGMGVPIEGYDNSAPACLPGYVADTDVLLIRRAATSDPVAPADLIAGDVYLQTIPRNSIMAFGADAADFTLRDRDETDAPIWPYHYALYYVRSCSVCADGGDGVPTLYRAELRNGSLLLTPVAEGVENVQFRFGIDETDDGSPDRYAGASDGALSADPEGWADVVAIEVSLLARALQPTPGYTDNKSYDLGEDDLIAPGGPFKRHAFKTVVRVINISSRRE